MPKALYSKYISSAFFDLVIRFSRTETLYICNNVWIELQSPTTISPFVFIFLCDWLNFLFVWERSAREKGGHTRRDFVKGYT